MTPGINEVQVGDTGVSFEIQIADQNGNVQDVSHVLSIIFTFQKPDSSIVTINGSLLTDGKDGYVRCVTGPSVFDQTGRWMYQVFLNYGGSAYYTDVGKFKVLGNLPIT